MCLAPYMFCEKETMNLDMSQYPGRILSVSDIQDNWPMDGSISNFTIDELFWPCDINMRSTYDFIGEDCVDYSILFFSSSQYDNGAKVMQRCRELAANVTGSTNQEKMASIVDLLNSIGTYQEKTYDSYDLLFNGKGNCMAFSNSVDCIARWLGIPCGEVCKGNHGWNIFIGSDGQVYEVDATNKIYPGLMGTTRVSEVYGEIEYKDTELQLLEYDRKLLEYHGASELPPPTEIVPTPTPQDDQEQPSEQPEDNPQPTEDNNETVSDNDIPTENPNPTEEVTPTPSPTPQQEETKPEESTEQQTTAPITAPTNATTETTTTTLAVPTIVSITPGQGSMTVDVSGAVKYEVRYRRSNRNNWMSYTTTNASFLSMGLLSGQTYYIQARAVQGNKYSDWTPLYQVTID